jgi:allophanate hydrolase subunit 1
MRFHAGQQALLVECAALEEVMGLHSALRSQRPAGVMDLVPAARTLLGTYGADATFARLVDEVVRREVRAVGSAHGRSNRRRGASPGPWSPSYLPICDWHLPGLAATSA